MCGLGVGEDMGDQGVVTCKTSSKIVLARASFCHQRRKERIKNIKQTLLSASLVGISINPDSKYMSRSSRDVCVCGSTNLLMCINIVYVCLPSVSCGVCWVSGEKTLMSIFSMQNDLLSNYVYNLVLKLNFNNK